MNDTPLATKASVPATASRVPSIALALGGGGARGLAHIPILEAFDELGVRPKIIAGTSIGAIFAAAYASGLSGRQIREHTYEVLRKRLDLVRDLYSARVRAARGFLNALAPRPAFLSAEKLLDIILPPRVSPDFAHLTTPLKIVASDFYAQEAVVFTSGPLRQAVAASMALPVIFQPMVIDGRVLIDGGLVNPLPFDIIADEADLTVAVDASGAPVRRPDQEVPKAWETLFAANFIFERTIIREKLRSRQPDLYIDAGTSRFQILDFLKLDEILAAAEPAKERVKAQLSRLLEAETLPEAIEHQPAHPPAHQHVRQRRPILKRRPPKA
ncbi:patatin-like phospholipase family protein [Hyphomicrobium sp. NDB2Meth4]|uniref:patatin-like phospholipase family protein n=1 Tax=Hyphomicrobium sp. NDB2Meth4 TaxID=1892846 RepID=UPI0009302DF6|nr:patatin-like phospholipase family protein [Hyphomicrobium sp. NDB2Meth4]